MQHAAVYLRTSKEDDAQKQGLPAQLKICEDYAKKEEFDIVDIFEDDGVSGAMLERDGLMQALAAAEQEKYQHLLIRNETRLGRALHVAPYLQELLMQTGLTLHYCETVGELTREKMQENKFRHLMADFDRTQIRQNLEGGRQHSMSIGGVMVGGKPPFGYEKVRVNVQGKDVDQLAILEPQAEVVKRIFDEYTAAETPILQICKGLNAENILPPIGKGKWVAKSVRSILATETYAGTWYGDKTISKKIGGKTITRNRPREEWIAVTVPAVVDDNTFSKAQKRLDSNARQFRGNHSSAADYIFRGRVYCSDCGTQYKLRSNAKAGKFQYIHSYNNKTDPCPNDRNFDRDNLDYPTVDYLIHLLHDSEFREKKIYRIYKPSPELDRSKVERVAVEKRLAAAVEKQERIRWSFNEGITTEDEYKADKGAIDERLATLTDQLATLQADAIPDKAYIERLLDEYDLLYLKIKASVDEADIEKYFKLDDEKAQEHLRTKFDWGYWADLLNVKIRIDSDPTKTPEVTCTFGPNLFIGDTVKTSSNELPL
jgi:site-specific DNA recombinase